MFFAAQSNPLLNDSNFYTNRSGSFTPDQEARLKDFIPPRLIWFLPGLDLLSGVTQLGLSIILIVVSYMDLFQKVYSLPESYVITAFRISVPLAVFFFVYMLTTAVYWRLKERRLRQIILEEILSNSIRSGTGEITIAADGEPLFQVNGRQIRLMDRNLAFDLIPHQQYSLHYLEKSALALSARPVDIDAVPDLEQREAFRLTLRSKNTLEELEMNRAGQITALQRSRLLSNLPGILLAFFFMVLVTIVMATMLTGFVGRIIPGTWFYYVAFILLQVLPAIAMGLFLFGLIRMMRSMVLDAYPGRVVTFSGAISKSPASLVPGSKILISRPDAIVIDKQRIEVPLEIYEALIENREYSIYCSVYEKKFLSVEPSLAAVGVSR